MKNILTILKVLTFINTKIVILSILLILLSICGYKSITSSLDRNNYLIKQVVKNEVKVVTIASINYKITKKNNEILSNCLNREEKYNTLKKDMSVIIKLKNELKIDSLSSNKIDSLLVEKSIVFKKIAEFDVHRVDVTEVLKPNTIKVVTKSTHKGLFRTKVEYDTITRNYSTLNKKLFKYVSNKTNLKNSLELNRLIKENNELNLNIYLITNKYSIDMFNKNLFEYSNITSKIHDNLINYLIVTTIIMLASGLVIYLLISDILKKKKSESRYRQMISMMIENNDKK
jgi:hypothetical protein